MHPEIMRDLRHVTIDQAIYRLLIDEKVLIVRVLAVFLGAARTMSAKCSHGSSGVPDGLGLPARARPTATPLEDMPGLAAISPSMSWLLRISVVGNSGLAALKLIPPRYNQHSLRV